MGSPLDLTPTNAFLAYCETNWLQNCQSDFKSHCYQRYVVDILALFTSPEHSETFGRFLNGQHVNMPFIHCTKNEVFHKGFLQ